MSRAPEQVSEEALWREQCEIWTREWLEILARLWASVGKRVEPEQLEVYRQSLGEIPMGLLEQAVGRVIRENVYPTVPTPGAVWAAMRKELGDPQDIRQAIRDLEARRWRRITGGWER